LKKRGQNIGEKWSIYFNKRDVTTKFWRNRLQEIFRNYEMSHKILGKIVARNFRRNPATLAILRFTHGWTTSARKLQKDCL